MRRAYLAESVDRRQACGLGGLGVIDVTHRHLDGHIRASADPRKFDDGDAASSRGGEAERRIGGDARGNEERSTPARRFKEPMEPAEGDRLRIQGYEPCQRAHLGPDTAGLSGDRFGDPEVLGSVSGDAAQEKRDHL